MFTSTLVRRLLLILILAALGLILVPRLFKRYPVQALVNAPAVELRAPAESVVFKTLSSSGKFEAEPQEFVQLRLRVADQLQALREQEAVLQRRVTRFLGEEKKRLEQELIAREGEFKRSELDLAAQDRELERQLGLVSAGFISPAQIDTFKLRNASAQVQREIARANVQRARSNLNGLVQQGFMGERSGGVDVSYTQQKLDEVRLRIAEMKAWASRVGSGKPAEPAVASLQTPGQGLLMGPFVTEGMFLAPGELIAHYVLCQRAFLDLAVPVMDLKDYRQGGTMSFRIAGEWQFYQGQVTQIFPLYQTAQKMALAVQTDQGELQQMARVWIQPDNVFLERMRRESNCMMGQKVHAQLPSRSGWLPSWTSFLADVF